MEGHHAREELRIGYDSHSSVHPRINDGITRVAGSAPASEAPTDSLVEMHLAFDRCSVPTAAGSPLDEMLAWWLYSPFFDIGVLAEPVEDVPILG